MQRVGENCEHRTSSHFMWIRCKKVYITKIQEIFAEVSKICCGTANKALNIVNNIAIQFVKEGNISKLAHKNMRKPSLLKGCTAWLAATDLKHNFIFPTVTALTRKRPDITIRSVKAKMFSLLS